MTGRKGFPRTLSDTSTDTPARRRDTVSPLHTRRQRPFRLSGLACDVLQKVAGG